jgi:Ca2+/H+ antiporter, TMEM165/GDT1 family
MYRGRSGFRKLPLVARVPLIILMVAAMFSLVTFVVMSLWNGVLAEVVAVKAITFWQAAGILLLSKILFGGFRRGWGGRHRSPWGAEMREKWQNMTEEERQKFKESWRGRCG